MSTNARERVHKSCTHRKYRMSCQQIDELRAESGERCQICGRLERYMLGILNIDHDHALGYWAVRGLLCPSCNNKLESGILVGPEVDAYLANPWHKRLPYSRYIVPEVPVSDDGILDWDTALHRVSEAADVYIAAQHRPMAERREARATLVLAAQVAARSGVTHKMIAAATNGAWTREYITTVVNERRRQPNRLAEAVANARKEVAS